MALDDVIIRAMSKQPGDRFPSAGDLGRAAQAALSGTSVAIPERTVATGAATLETGRLQPEPEDPLTGPVVEGPKRRPLLIGGGLAAIVAIAVAAFVLASGGGGGGGGGSANAADTTATTADAGGEEPEEEPKEKEPKRKLQPRTLTRAQLISQGDAICTNSRETFLGYRDEFPTGETEPSVGYSQLLVGISSEAVQRFNKLHPPQAVEREYDAYVASQEQVAKWDGDALEAAQAGDEAAYLVAREERNNTEPERRQLAEAIGFQVCSGSEA
jgi:hypothetical protein